MDRKRPRVDARDSDSRRPPSPRDDRPPSKLPRRDDRGLHAPLHGRVAMSNQRLREQQGSRDRPREQQQQHRDSGPPPERQQPSGSDRGGSRDRDVSNQPGRDREPGRDRPLGRLPQRDINGRDSSRLGSGPQFQGSRDGGRDRSSSAPCDPTPAGAFKEPEINRQRASKYDMSSSTPRPRPGPYNISSSQRTAGSRPASAQQQRSVSARGGPPLAQHSSRPAGHFQDSRHRPLHQQQNGSRQQHNSGGPVSGGRDRPGQPASQHRGGGSSSAQPGLGERERDRPPASRDSSRARERPAAEQRGTAKPRAEEPGGAAPSSSSRQQSEAVRRYAPAAATAAEGTAVQPHPATQTTGQQQHAMQAPPQHQQPQRNQQQTGVPEHLQSEQQQRESSGGTQQQQSQEHGSAAAASNDGTQTLLEEGEAAADAAAAAAAAAGSGKRRPIAFNLSSLPAPPVDELKPRVSSKYSLPQLGTQQEPPAEQQQGNQQQDKQQQAKQQQQQQGGRAVGRTSGDGGAAASASFWRDVGPLAGRSRHTSEAASHSEQGRSSDVARISNNRRRSDEPGYGNEPRRSSGAGYSSDRREQPHSQQRRSSSGAAASGGGSRSRSPSRSRSLRPYSRDRSRQRSGSREPAVNRHAVLAHSDQQQQQPSSSVRGSQPASSEHEGAGAGRSRQREPSEDQGRSAGDVEMQQLGSQPNARLQQQQQGGRQSQQVPAAGSSRHHISPVTPHDANTARGTAVASAAAPAAGAAPGIARMRSLTPVATTTKHPDAQAGVASSLAALQRPTQQITLPLQPASPLSAPQPAAAAFVASRPAEVEQMLAALRARRQGMVALQLRGLPISRHMSYKETWARACKAGRLRPDAVDGPLAAARRRTAATQALRPRFGASLLSPVDPAVPLAVAGRGEEAHIQQLQQVIDVMAVQEGAAYCEQLPDGGSMLLPGKLRGLLW